MVNIDNGEQGGTDWNCFLVNKDGSFYFDSFGGNPDKFLRQQLPRPMIVNKYKIQNFDNMLCGSYCLYFFYLMERMNFYDTILKLDFDIKYH